MLLAWEWVLDTARPFPVEVRTVSELLDWVATETGWRVRFEDPDLAKAADGIVFRAMGPCAPTGRRSCSCRASGSKRGWGTAP